MANSANEPGGWSGGPVRRGDEITAEFLNQVIEGVLKRITGTAPIAVRAAGRNLVISTNAFQGRPPAGSGGGASPCKVVSYVVDVNNPNLWIVDLYDDGYTDAEGHPLPATKTGVLAESINPSPNYSQGQRAAIFVDGGKNWLFWEGDAQEAHPAKINQKLVSSPGYYLIDLYDNDFPQPPTITGVAAYVIDEHSFDFQIGQRISAFQMKNSGKWYISTQRFFQDNISPPWQLVKVIAETGAASYSVQNIDFPGGTVSGPPYTAFEMNGSDLVAPGSYVVLANFITNGGHWFWFPLGDCT